MMRAQAAWPTPPWNYWSSGCSLADLLLAHQCLKCAVHHTPWLQPNPRNPRFAPMRLYVAEKVAQRALQYGTSHVAPATPQGI